MVEIQVVAVQQLEGRETDYVRVLGYFPTDLLRRVVEVSATPADAVAILEHARATRTYPVLEVPDNRWVHTLTTGEKNFIHLKE